jgi:sterol desaturase/sphingolipid hydroxylase (fatty acid hydroxylase superfamily)
MRRSAPYNRLTDVVETLNTLVPVIAIVSIAVFATVERWVPYFEHGAGRSRQRWHNLGLVAIGFLMNAVIGSLVVAPVVWADAHRFGLLYRLNAPAPLAMVAGIFIIDFCLYVQHVIMHSVPALWRIHRVHHADADLDATSGLRTHPLELLLLLSTPSIVMVLVGLPLASGVIYNTIGLPWFLLNHSNMKFPTWFERWGSLLMSTPDWHRVHHSSHQPETDSHYGCLFSIWDRLFGTARKADVPSIRFGLAQFREPADQTTWQLLKMPFR